MSHPFDCLPIDQTSRASLMFTPCPGTKGESLQESLETLKNAGATALITLMPASELITHQAQALGEYCQATGLAWFHCPIEDDHAPQADFAEAWQLVGPIVHQMLSAGKIVAIHCKGGSGRTGLMASQILVERGQDKLSVKSKIQTLRPYALTLAPHLAYFNNLTSIETATF